ncbi:MAG: phosphoribosylaminoimidazolesuccinocarboxamide synthase [Flavobacteriales bacterium]
MTTILHTDFHFPGQTSAYHGKVRDMYSLADGRIIGIVSDRISAFDVVLPRGIPHKGAVLNGVANHFLDAVSDIVPTWKLGAPHSHVTIGHQCEPIRIEMVIRGHLTGHAWRMYAAGHRRLCGVEMPEGMREHDRFSTPIITPATKAQEGHDEDISREEILTQGLIDESVYSEMERITQALFQRGCEMAAEQGLILVDTKYEFGLKEGQLMLIDEIHTPDSSRYFYADGYAERQRLGQPQRQLSKEFVREWLMDHGFMGKVDQQVPEMTDDFVQLVSSRYIELYERLTGKSFNGLNPDPLADLESKVISYLNSVRSESLTT